MLRFINLLLFFSCWNFVFAQFSSDSLKLKSFEYLFDKFDSSNVHKTQDIYASAIINKAKKDKDTLRLVAGYSFKSDINSDWLHLVYLDSIIDISIVKSNKYQPTIAYLGKASYYYSKGEYNKALTNVIEARKYALSNLNKELEIECSQRIATLKTRLGNSEEALVIFKENLEYYSQPTLNSNRSKILELNAIHSIAVTYNDLNQFDSTSYYNKWGFQKALKLNNEKYKNYFRLNQGVNLFKKSLLNEALDSLIKSVDGLNGMDEKANQAIANFYIAKLYDKKLNSKNAINYFKKVDSIFRISNNIHPNLRETYERLIRYYENIGDYPNQLEYVNQLIKLDSILHQNEMYLNTEIIKEYDIPNLISEKERIISILQKKNRNRVTYFYWLIGIFLILLFGFNYQYRKRKIYKKRFNDIINNNKSIELENSDFDLIPKEINISEELVKKIQFGLKEFEKHRGYLDQDLTLQDLAKEMNSNASYLSKVVNYYKKESFTHYINSLRIEYALNELKTNEVFRKYTLKAIANEVGFKKSESFSKAFLKKTGIKPTYFLKQLTEKEKE